MKSMARAPIRKNLVCIGSIPALIAVPGQSRTKTILYAWAMPASATTNPGQPDEFEGRQKSVKKSIVHIMQSMSWSQQEIVRLRNITAECIRPQEHI
jgi:hypothetical protein